MRRQVPTPIHGSRAQLRGLAAVVIALASALFATPTVSQSATGCSATPKELMPIGNGPMVFAASRCVASGLRPGVNPPILSSDRQSFLAYDVVARRLWFAKVGSGQASGHVDADRAGGFASSRDLPFAWSSDGGSIYGVRQEVMRPRGGWALGPLEPFVASVDGPVQPLPALTSPAGTLDELHWVGNAGLAVALFGAKGEFYRPAHSDPEPTMALVDAKAGRVIQSVPVGSLMLGGQFTIIRQVAGRIDNQQRVEAIITFLPNHWVLWEEGKQPVRMPIDIDTLRSPFALSPDGRSMLVMRGLSATGMICEHNPHCPPPTPRAGTAAELRDTQTGKVLWSIMGYANTFSGDLTPAISPDGRYALISLPGDRRVEAAALVEMASGKALQKIPSAGAYYAQLGFSADNSTAWASGFTRLVEYRLSR